MLSIIRSGLVRDKGLHLQKIQWQTSPKKYFFPGMHTYGKIEYSWFWADWVMGQRRSECWNNRAHKGMSNKKMSHRGCLRASMGWIGIWESFKAPLFRDHSLLEDSRVHNSQVVQKAGANVQKTCLSREMSMILWSPWSLAARYVWIFS